jgi:methylated-DNA-[protein]-cysteine S-methyltransferase
MPISSLSFESPLGWIAFTQHAGRLSALVFGHPSRSAAERGLARSLRTDQPRALYEPDETADELAERLRLFVAGEPIDFQDVCLDLQHLTPFARRVVTACRRIPWGQTRSYGQLAAAVGSPGAARAVGQVMAGNRFPLVVPCHRVLAAGGRLGGFSAPQGTRMKARLLRLESPLVVLSGG